MEQRKQSHDVKSGKPRTLLSSRLEQRLRLYSMAAGVTLAGTAATAPDVVHAATVDLPLDDFDLPSAVIPTAELSNAFTVIVRSGAGDPGIGTHTAADFAVPLDFDGDGNSDFFIQVYTTIPRVVAFQTGAVPQWMETATANYYPARLSSGQVISSGGPFPFGGFGFGNAIARAGSPDPWEGNGEGYIGVKLLLDLDGPGGNPAMNYFGYICLSIPNGTGSVTITKYAFENQPGQAILAGADVSLPVELTNFDVHIQGRDLQLNWQTATETNNAGFEIQMKRHVLRNGQAADGAFEAVDFVSGRGTTTEAQYYSHTLSNLDPGRYTFRLKQVDLDGTFSFSQEVEVVIDVPTTHYLGTAYPNPFNPSTTFDLSIAKTQSVLIEVYDVMGQQVGTVHSGVLEANEQHQFRFTADDLPSGTYLLKVTGQTFQETQQIVLVK